ncbi:MAG: apolipoprotein N-acyltransferase, partial [Planctomicrobium sp.]|nr:apolipoprotein N-acyltransferase [Planctomicrobium sp.]
GSSELDQHLITSKFRAIETRTPLVRAVNTGISAIIDGDGVIRTPEHFIDFDATIEKTEPRTSMRDPQTGKFHRQLNCAIVGDVPLDSRNSLYVRLGDWFAAFCLIATIAVFIQVILKRKSES